MPCQGYQTVIWENTSIQNVVLNKEIFLLQIHNEC